MYKRWPDGRFLIPCGLVASAFGILFGEVFALENVIPVIWKHPLQDPVDIMLAPLIFGILLMLLGLVFNGIEAWWRSEFRSWLLSDAAVLTLYASALLSVLYSSALWITLCALIWYLAGVLIRTRYYEDANFIPAIGNLIQSVFELTLNTISFLRVGAFALAHAALSAGAKEIVSLIPDSTVQIILFVILHIFIILIEAFVVFVQTTRLIVFEFFIRFLHVEGRIFKPLKLPDAK
jgi:V/A-type H+-transporting ATPase subunit I